MTDADYRRVETFFRIDLSKELMINSDSKDKQKLG
jgi:hypothetical protein